MAAMFPGWKSADAGRGGLGLGAPDRDAAQWHPYGCPRHYSSTTNGGEPAFGIDELPLEWCLRPGVRLIFRHVADGRSCSRRICSASWRE